MEIGSPRLENFLILFLILPGNDAVRKAKNIFRNQYFKLHIRHIQHKIDGTSFEGRSFQMCIYIYPYTCTTNIF